MTDEERIERLLAELGRGESPQGMERRLVHALERHTAARAEGGWRWMRLARLWSVPVLATVFVMALLLTSSLLRRLGHGVETPRVAVGNAVPEASRGPVDPGPEASRTAGMTTPQRRGAPREPVVAKTVRTEARHGKAARGEVLEPSRAVVERMNGNVADASFAPSVLAPPLPLTQQERLLLQVVHRGGPEEVAELDARVRDERLLEARAEFERFFAPPELPKQDQ